MDKYFDVEIEAVKNIGYQDGLAGKMDCRVLYRFAYLSGNQDGTRERAKKIHDDRVENMKKIRRIK